MVRLSPDEMKEIQLTSSAEKGTSEEEEHKSDGWKMYQFSYRVSKTFRIHYNLGKINNYLIFLHTASYDHKLS